MSSQVASSSPFAAPPTAIPTSASQQHNHREADNLLALSSSPSQHAPAWHFPFGPSSRYHTRERSQSSLSQQSRGNYYYASTAPTLVTEIRSQHRRSRSSLPLNTMPASQHAPTAAANQSPRPLNHQYHARSPLSRFSSDPAGRSDKENMRPRAVHRHRRQKSQVTDSAPVTPAKSPPSSSAALRDSPFSDYFTDENRSIDHALQPNATQQLLVRMSKLQSHLMRSDGEAEQDALTIVERKLNEIDLELNSLSAQSLPRSPALRKGLFDSGVFFEGDEDSPTPTAVDDSSDVLTANSDVKSSNLFMPTSTSLSTAAALRTDLLRYKSERAAFEQKMSLMLQSITRAQSELRQRYAEVREINHQVRVEIEEKDARIEDLRSECEGMRSDAGFDHSELLFLKLQLKALEMEVSGEDGGALESSKEDGTDGVEGQQVPHESRDARRNRILAEMDRWRMDWDDVDARFKRRRSSRYGDLASCASPTTLRRGFGARKDSGRMEEADTPNGSEDNVEWRLHTVKEGHGRVTSVTIKRVDSSGLGIMSMRDDEQLPETAASNHVLAAGEKGTDSATIAGATADDEAQATAELIASDSSHLHASIASSYIDHSTQTEPLFGELEIAEINGSLSLADSSRRSSLSSPQSEGRVADEYDPGEEDDCAITTSSEDNNDGDDDEVGARDTEDAKQNVAPPSLGAGLGSATIKSAWEELWDGLANLTGMGEDRFE